ncbi:uncharacterized protein EURHEDRAFT_373186 [Aspergillus ruber CBS 135680]|uniref:Uncharacterized protein n=1 Tax=Aspergillus ruber (strain CBS 135680) TaxID=1388766 RepID=A0A017S154_ASPRC|nr:uncharacterized protein EURHEDRAFT_373186 [Aspergillus ruber CBS 135680]EYE89905.1 hypothetical protein EURHEDRAFT_373186 [Aspergillus ruber CBS 135680]
MPSFANDYHTATPPPVDSPQGKPHEKAPVGNTFLWTNNWPNGDTTSHRDAAAPSTDRLANLKNASAYSVNGHRSSISSSHNRDLPQSKDGSMYSQGNGSARDPRDTGRPSTTLDRDIIAGAGSGAGSAAASISSQQFMGTSQSSRSLYNGRPTVNGDHTPRPSVDQLVASDCVANTSMSALSSSQPEESFGRLSSDPGRLSPRTTSPHRYSSPPIPTGIDGAASGNPPQSPTQQQQQDQSSLRHRHTLQVPRSASARRNSRDHSEDTAQSSGRLSPTAGIRRTSMSLARRTTRTNHSDSIADESIPDEDAARYAEAIKQRRASRRRRRDDDDDDRVIVGTKVDQNHVNWVTAYNMLTGIRFTVSRINAKLERELTPADFEAKHKFSFDMYVSLLMFCITSCTPILTTMLAPEMSWSRRPSMTSSSRITLLGSFEACEPSFALILLIISCPSQANISSLNWDLQERVVAFSTSREITSISSRPSTTLNISCCAGSYPSIISMWRRTRTR